MSEEGLTPAFDLLYRHVTRSVRRYAETRLGSGWQDADDVVQEVWIRARACFPTFERDRCFRGWIFGFVTRVICEAQRGALPPLSGAARASMEGREPSADRDLETLEEIRSFARWAGALPRLDRRVLLLRGLDGRPHGEVAAALDLTPDAVRKRWSRLLDRIRERRPSSRVRRGASPTSRRRPHRGILPGSVRSIPHSLRSSSEDPCPQRDEGEWTTALPLAVRCSTRDATGRLARR